MSETVEVIAQADMMVPAGLMSKGDRFITTQAQADVMVAEGRVKLAKKAETKAEAKSGD